MDLESLGICTKNDIYTVKTNYIIQPYRSRHCKLCKTCITKFDHHCWWIGGCVGELNHFQFWIFTFLQTITYILSIEMAFNALNYRNNPSKHFDPDQKIHIHDHNHLLLVLCFMISFLGFLMVGFLTCYHFYLISTG